MRTVVETADLLRRREASASEVLEASLTAIDTRNGALNAFVHLDVDGARRHAAEIDRRIAAGDDVGPLAGVPFGVKDLDDCAGMPTTHGSRWYQGLPPV